jgi:D-aminopeptidase
LRGTEPTSSAQSAPLKPSSRSAVATISLQQRERAVVEFHHHAVERRQCRLDLDHPQVDRLVGAEYRTRCDAEQKCITNLAGSAGNGYGDR